MQNIAYKKDALKCNSTKTSLFSQSGQKGELNEGIANIFANLIHENEEYNEGLIQLAQFSYSKDGLQLKNRETPMIKANY